MQTAGITIERNTRGEPVRAHIDLKKYGARLQDFFDAEGVKIEAFRDTQVFAKTEAPECMNFKIKKSEDYSDAEILVYNSMINAAQIIAKNS